MIDKNGKLFGRINIIDLLIILIVVAALAFFAVRLVRNAAELNDPESAQNSAGKHPVLITFYADEAPIVLRDQMEKQLGCPVRNWDNGNSKLGTLKSYQAEDGFTYVWDESAEKPVELPTTYTFRLSATCEVDGTITDSGLNVGGYTYYIGGSYTICVGQTRIYFRLADFEYVDSTIPVSADA